VVERTGVRERRGFRNQQSLLSWVLVAMVQVLAAVVVHAQVAVV
jgi:hypothetical protein